MEILIIGGVLLIFTLIAYFFIPNNIFSKSKTFIKLKLLKLSLFGIFIFLICSLLLKIFYLFIYKLDLFSISENWSTFFVWLKQNTPSTIQYIKELDIAGFLGGLISLVIGVYITALVEEQNEKERINLDDKIAKLDKGLLYIKDISNRNVNSSQLLQKSISKIHNATEEIKESNRKILTEFPAIIDSAKKIVKEAKTKLYIMTYSASFGRLYCYIQEQLQEYMKLKKSSVFNSAENSITAIEYSNNFWKMIDFTDELFDSITQFPLKKENPHLTFCTLNTVTQDNNDFVNKYVNLVMAGSTSSTFLEKSELKNVSFVGSNTKTFLCIPNEGDTINYSENANNYIIDKTIKIHNDHIERLKKISVSNSNCEVHELSDIPLQMIIGISDTHNSQHLTKVECLVIFANEYNLGTPESITGFTSTDPRIVDSFLKMFNSVISSKGNAQSSKQLTTL